MVKSEHNILNKDDIYNGKLIKFEENKKNRNKWHYELGAEGSSYCPCRTEVLSLDGLWTESLVAVPAGVTAAAPTTAAASPWVLVPLLVVAWVGPIGRVGEVPAGPVAVGVVILVPIRPAGVGVRVPVGPVDAPPVVSVVVPAPFKFSVAFLFWSIIIFQMCPVMSSWLRTELYSDMHTTWPSLGGCTVRVKYVPMPRSSEVFEEVLGVVRTVQYIEKISIFTSTVPLCTQNSRVQPTDEPGLLFGKPPAVLKLFRKPQMMCMFCRTYQHQKRSADSRKFFVFIFLFNKEAWNLKIIPAHTESTDFISEAFPWGSPFL